MGAPAAGPFCWLDLAAADAALAKHFYGAAFGWAFDDRRANGGVFTQCLAGGRAFASLYQLRRAELASGAPSHWTPYIGVKDAAVAADRAAALGGRIVVAPFDVEGIARIALIQDAVGALVGIWQAEAQSTAAPCRTSR